MNAISSAAIAKISACGHQEIGNISWALATLCLRDMPLLDAIAAESIATITAFNVQGIANTAWALAKLSVTNAPFFESIASASLPKIRQWDPQALANIAWSDATMNIVDEPLLDAISAQALRTISQFTTQNLSNTVWAYATLKVSAGEPFASLQEPGPTVCDAGEVAALGDFTGEVASYSAEEIMEALALQGFGSTPVEAIVAANGELDAEATVAEAFGASVIGDGSGVLVIANGHYLACVREHDDAAPAGTLKARDVLAGFERVMSAADFADHVARFECFRVARH